MIPKEKADELYEAFFYSIPSFTDEGQLEHKTAKQCALIAVDEIIKSTFSKKWYDKNNIIVADYLLNDYWQEVKKEIEKL